MGKSVDVPLRLLLKPEGFRQRIVSLISKTAIPQRGEFLASLLGCVPHIEANGDSLGTTSKLAASSSKNAVSFSSACTTKRFPSPRCASAIQTRHTGHTFNRRGWLKLVES